MPTGLVHALYTAPAPGIPMAARKEVRAVPGKGLEGDRYFLGQGTFSIRMVNGKETTTVTLMELETFQVLEQAYDLRLDPAESRRNVITRGARLNELVGRRFKLGDVVLVGAGLCEPCALLARAAGDKRVLAGLVHRGGLRAEILTGGNIRVGAAVTPTDLDADLEFAWS